MVDVKLLTEKQVSAWVHYSADPNSEEYKTALRRGYKTFEEALYATWRTHDSNLLFKLKDGSRIEVNQPECVGWEYETPWLDVKRHRSWGDMRQKLRSDEKGWFVVSSWGSGADNSLYRVMIAKEVVADIVPIEPTLEWKAKHLELVAEKNRRAEKIQRAQDPDNLVELYERVDRLEQTTGEAKTHSVEDGTFPTPTTPLTAQQLRVCVRALSIQARDHSANHSCSDCDTLRVVRAHLANMTGEA